MLICEFDVRPRVDPRFADYASSWISMLNKPNGYLLGSYRIATAPEPNSSRLTSLKSTYFDSPANNVGPWPTSPTFARPRPFHPYDIVNIGPSAIQD